MLNMSGGSLRLGYGSHGEWRRGEWRMANGEVVEMKPGDLFYVPPSPHDSWVIGDEPYVSLHFVGAAGYAKKGE